MLDFNTNNYSKAKASLFPSESEIAMNVKRAIDEDILNFFEFHERKEKQPVLVKIKVAEKYTLIEYAIVKNKVDAVAYFLDEKKWGMKLLKQENAGIYKALAELCHQVKSGGGILQIGNAQQIFQLLKDKGINIQEYETILNEYVSKMTNQPNRNGCLVM